MEKTPRALEIAKKLIAFDTTNPPGNQNQCPEWIESLLKKAGISAKTIDCGGVKSVIAEMDFGPGKTICICGHWDVAQADESEWKVTKPFSPKEMAGMLYGRGAADMKGSLSAMLSVLLNIKETKDLRGKLVFIAFGDEEAGSERGAKKILETLIDFDYILIGEPTNMKPKIARKGAILLNLKVFNSKIDAAEIMDSIISSLSDINRINVNYEEPDEFCSIKSKIVNSGEIDRKMTPDEVELSIDMRHMKPDALDTILGRISDKLDRMGAIYKIQGTLVTQPYNIKEGELLEVAKRAIHEATGRIPTTETNDASSDARFFAKKGLEVIELGLDDSTIHAPDEHCSIEDLNKLEIIYHKIITGLLSRSH